MHWESFRLKMVAAGLGETAIRAFEYQYQALADGRSALIPEGAIAPVGGLPDSRDLAAGTNDGGTRSSTLMASTIFIKLNGGLGTGMGLEKAKSLLEVKNGRSFLDLIARQIVCLGEAGARPRVLFMNSFSTSADTLEALARHPELGEPSTLELMQNRVPKVDADTLEPVGHPANPDLEWCPPGHGDLYTVLEGSGMLDHLLDEGIEYAFVSNSDNLGATLDPDLLGFFASSGQSFMMEVTRRTASDRKGGHLCRELESGRLILRESAQCPGEDAGAFQDIDRHRYFNTNNLWLHLPSLRSALRAQGGILPLPSIRNHKTIDPRDKKSRPVIQLETAMGSAIACFDQAGAVEVPRSRFAPVKTCADLLALRSDAYRITDQSTVELHPSLAGVPPRVDLDPAHYQLIDGMERLIADAVPSLVACRSLRIRGAMAFRGETEIAGDVELTNPSDTRHDIPSRRYEDECAVI